MTQEQYMTLFRELNKNAAVVPARLRQETRSTVIVMPVHGALDYVRRTCRSLCTISTSLIVVDDASDTETFQFLTEFARTRPNTTLIRNNKQQLFTRTVNRGLRAARRANPDYVCVLNSDCELYTGWVQSLEALMDKYPDVGKVAYRDSTDTAYETEYEEVQHPGYLTGHCFMVRTRLLDELGVLVESDYGQQPCVFPELSTFKGLAHIGSDRELTYRIQGAGYKTVYSNFRGCAHEAGKSWGHDLGWLASFELELLWPPNDHIN